MIKCCLLWGLNCICTVGFPVWKGLITSIEHSEHKYFVSYFSEGSQHGQSCRKKSVSWCLNLFPYIGYFEREKFAPKWGKFFPLSVAYEKRGILFQSRWFIWEVDVCWVDDLQFFVLFKNISVISGQLEGDNWTTFMVVQLDFNLQPLPYFFGYKTEFYPSKTIPKI